MYIDSFLAGILFTLLVEMSGLILMAIINHHRRK